MAVWARSSALVPTPGKGDTLIPDCGGTRVPERGVTGDDLPDRIDRHGGEPPVELPQGGLHAFLRPGLCLVPVGQVGVPLAGRVGLGRADTFEEERESLGSGKPLVFHDDLALTRESHGRIRGVRFFRRWGPGDANLADVWLQRYLPAEEPPVR